MASTYLSRTLGTSTNTYKGTVSVWLKRSGLNSDQVIYGNYTSGTQRGKLVIAGDGKLMYYQNDGGSNTIKLETNRLFRDVGAFYHIVLSVDTTQATEADRVKLYINGTQETSFATATYPSQNLIFYLNANSVLNYIGQEGNSSDYWDGSMSYFSVVDGTAYDASYFGETNAATGIWKIKTSPSVTYGTNGFFLKMDTSSPGSDTSGNNNTFTASGTPTLAQDNASNNFCTLTPLIRMAITLNNGNTQVTDTDSAYYGVGSTMGVSSGKWYWEYKLTRIGNYAQDGVMGGLPGNGYNDIYNTYVGSKTAGVALNTGEGKIYSADSSTTWFGGANSQGQIIGVALDLDNNKIYYSQNGVFGNSSNPATNTNGYALSATIIANKPLLPCSSINNCTIDYNFGNGFFGTTAVASSNADAAGHGLMEYAVPTGFYTLNTKNLNTYGG